MSNESCDLIERKNKSKKKKERERELLEGVK